MTTTIIHAGLHKTGTTTLQDFCADNRNWLAERGVHYPADLYDEWAGHHRLACRLSSARPSNGCNDLFTPEREVFSEAIGARKQPLEAFSPAISTDLAFSLLSSEIFETFNAVELANLESFLGHIDRFVLYVRNGVSYIFSCWSAKVNWGYTGSFDTFLRATVEFEPMTPVLGPIRFVDLLIERFGKDRIKVRSLDAALQHPRGLIGDFVEQELGLAEPKGLATNLRSNASPPAVVTEVQRALNVLAGPSRPGIAPASHNTLRTALAGPNGEEMLADFEHRLTPIMKTITIGHLRPAEIARDGSIASLSEPLAHVFADWRLAFDERAWWCETEELLRALAQCESFAQVAGPI